MPPPSLDGCPGSGARVFTGPQLSLTASLRSLQVVKKVVKKPVKKVVKKVPGKSAKTFAGKTTFGEGPLGTAKSFFSEENWAVQAIKALQELPK